MKLFLFFLSLTILHFAFGQTKLSGKVIDSITKKPLAGVSIFLSNTSLGTVSNDNGGFKIENIPPGKYELIASSLNYKTTVTTLPLGQSATSILINMPFVSNQLEEVIVESFDTEGWDNWGEYFKRNFIGTSSIINKCTLKNPDIVKFKLNKKTNVVRAFAREKLIFENNALGYIVKYLLVTFEFDINANTFKYIGYPLFEKMVSQNNEQNNKWEIERLTTYHGSMMHFIRSLFSDQLHAEGFEIRTMKKIDIYERKRVKSLLKKNNEKRNLNSISGVEQAIHLEKDTLEYYSRVNTLSDEEDQVIFDKKAARESIIFPLDSSVDKNALFFEFDDYLHITYLHKKEPYEYTKYLLKRPNKDFISSDIFLPWQKGVTIYKNGSYFYGGNIFTYGYWAWSEKLSTMLPYDYLPAK